MATTGSTTSCSSTASGSTPEKESFIVETGQSLHRTKRTRHYVGTITPNSKFYVAQKCRWLLGVEHLALQSIFYENRNELMRYEDSLLKNLAGNAFEGSCCAAAIYATCVLMSTGSAKRHAGVISER